MKSFRQWEEDVNSSMRDDAIDRLIERLERELIHHEIDDEIVRMSEDAHELAFHNYHCA